MLINAAIIDDGVNHTICPSLRQSWAVEGNHIKVCVEPDEYSHATTCLKIIERYAGTADVAWHSIRVLNPETKCGNLDSFLRAFDFCLALNIKLIHLSMGSGHYGDFPAIESEIKKLINNGVIIISALSNSGRVTYPACLDGVIGVRHHPGLLGDAYTVLPKTFENINFCASSTHELFHNNEVFVTPLANSYAAPVITAKTLALLKTNPLARYEDVYHHLLKGAADYPPVKDGPPEPGSEAPPVVTFSGFPTEGLWDTLLALGRKFKQEEYYCILAGQISSGVPANCVEIPEDAPLDAYVERICRFFSCSILILVLEQIDMNHMEMYNGIDVWVIHDHDERMKVFLKEAVLNGMKDCEILIADAAFNAEVLYNQMLSLFTS